MKPSLPDTGTARGDLTEQLRRVSAFYASPVGSIFAQLLANAMQDPVATERLSERLRRAAGTASNSFGTRPWHEVKLAPRSTRTQLQTCCLGPVMWRLMSGSKPLTSDEADKITDAALGGLLTLTIGEGSKGQPTGCGAPSTRTTSQSGAMCPTSGWSMILVPGPPTRVRKFYLLPEIDKPRTHGAVAGADQVAPHPVALGPPPSRRLAHLAPTVTPRGPAPAPAGSRLRPRRGVQLLAPQSVSAPPRTGTPTASGSTRSRQRRQVPPSSHASTSHRATASSLILALTVLGQPEGWLNTPTRPKVDS